jgi:hypothetical protein
MFALALAACGDDKNETETGSTTKNTTGMTTTDASATEPATTDPATTEPATTDPATDTTDGASSTSTGDPVDLDCASYCGLYESGCADFSEYANTEDCLAQCGQWPAGLPNETAGDSLGCRTYHVTVANMADAKLHCPHAGPSGGGVCVAADAPTCGDYCTTYFANCTNKLNSYKNMDDCQMQCATWYQGFDGQTDGDTVGCREYHAGVAIGDPDTHCPHAGPGGGGVCVAK